MKLIELVKPENLGYKLRHKSWKEGSFVRLTKMTKEKFTLNYDDKFERKFVYKDWSSGWELVNSDKIRQRLGVK